MFVVHSKFALSWPTLNFRIRKGENRFKSPEAIPSEARAKLEYLSKPKKTRDGQRLEAAVRFYEDATTVGGAAVASDDVDLTSAGLKRLGMKELQTLADKLGVDHKGLNSKEAVRDAILAEANGTAGAELDADDSDEDDADDDV